MAPYERHRARAGILGKAVRRPNRAGSLEHRADGRAALVAEGRVVAIVDTQEAFGERGDAHLFSRPTLRLDQLVEGLEGTRAALEHVPLKLHVGIFPEH